MKAYKYSNSRFCKSCGFTNKLFKVMNVTNGKNKTWISKECRDCFLERIREYNKIYQKKEKYIEYQKKYREKFEDKTLIDRVRKYRNKLKKNRLIEENRKINMWRELK